MVRNHRSQISPPLSRWISLAGLLVAIVQGPSVSRAEDANLKRLKAEYPAALARFREAYSNVKASGSILNENGKKSFEITIAVRGELRKLRVRTFQFDQAGDLVPRSDYDYCVGPTEFEATRDASSGGDYAILNVGRASDAKGETATADDRVRRSFDQSGGKFLFAPFKAGPTEVPWIVENYRITASERIVEDGREVLRFRYTTDDSKKKKAPPASGLFEVLPGRGWALRRYELAATAFAGAGPKAPKIDIRQVITVEYGDDQGGVPVPKRVHYSSMGKTQICEFDQVLLGAETPEREFTLAHYRLPDVTRPVADPARDHATHWLLGMAAAALLAAIALGRRSLFPSRDSR